MNIIPKSVEKVIESFQKLPGIGPKTAARLAFYLLHVPQIQLDEFADSLSNLKKKTLLCNICKNTAESDPCKICSNPLRDNSQICVVEHPNEVVSIEKTGKFKGHYHVLHGAIDPLNNIGPDEIFVKELIKRINTDSKKVKEIIIATNPNMEGEATAMYIAKQISNLPAGKAGLKSQMSKRIKVTRLARGLPVGADIEYADEVTLSRALEGRREY